MATESSTPNKTIRLEASHQAPSAARQAVSSACKRQGLPVELCNDAALLTSELVTNAVSHAKSAPTLRIDLWAGGIRVAVDDQHSDKPKQQAVNDPNSENGRGLLLVESLASRWGTEMVAGGKQVWFEIRAQQPAGTAGIETRQTGVQ